MGVTILGMIISYIIAFFVSFNILGHSSYDEIGTPLEQSLGMIGSCLIIGFALGFFQYVMLRDPYRIHKSWIYTIPAGLVIVELLVGIVCLQADLSGRMEFNEVQNLLTFAAYGLAIGIFQFLILRKIFKRSIIWIPTYIIALISGILLTVSVQDTELMILILISGMIIYGGITGITLLWVLVPKEKESVN